MPSKPRLTVYTASAGAGKTHTLTRDFISFALRRPEDYYRHILAVTFTRKATKEMKSRIIEEFYRLANGKSHPDALNELAARTGLSKEALQHGAARALTAILTDYTSFRIKTIDSFFEDIVRSFALEIGYGTRYKIELDAALRLHRATLLLFNNLADPALRESYHRIGEIVRSEIREGNKYNILSSVEALGKELFSDIPLQLASEGRLPDNRAIDKAREALETYRASVQVKAPESLSSSEKCFNLSAETLLDQLSLLGTLGDLNATMRQLGRDTNTMLLHSSQTFIKQIVDASDAPFIYERVGTRINHFMIDEFQDTSRLQFYNLKPLINNSLSTGHDNLLVGDVKQSIYKFRHCDRTILSKEVPVAFPDYLRSEVLPYNWRSAKQIVAFNNGLFGVLPRLVADFLRNKVNKTLGTLGEVEVFDNKTSARLADMTDELELNFRDVRQRVPEGRAFEGGIEVVHTGKGVLGLDTIAEQILRLVEEKGYSPGDIAVLCYRNSEVANVATALLRYSKEHPEKAHLLRFTGSEALHITNSLLVCFVIDILRALNHPEVTAYAKMALFRYEEMMAQVSSSSVLPFSELLATLGTAFLHLNLYDLTERIIMLCRPFLAATEMPYVLMLLDLVFTFTRDEVADLYSFLQWWDTKGYKTDLPQENIPDAISLLTVHKAKGLEFPIVLLPFPSWKLGFTPPRGRHSFLWVSLPEAFRKATGCKLEVAPVKRVKDLEGTVFLEDYFRELTAELIDRLNLFYVATTRPKKGLILWLPEEKKSTVPSGTDFPLEYFLMQAMKELAEGQDQAPLLCEIPHKSEAIPQAVEVPTIVYPPLPSIFCAERPNLSIRLRGERSFEENQQIQYGAAMHEVLSSVRTIEDLPEAIKAAVDNGLLLREGAAEEETKLRSVLQHPEVAPWFAPEVTVFNEQTILSPREIHFSRPDRIVRLPNGTVVVVDYKFGHPEARYRRQIVRYCKLIRCMGFDDVEGYLLYLCGEGHKVEYVYPDGEQASPNSLVQAPLL